MLVPSESSSAVLVMMNSKSVSVSNRSRARRANNDEITILGGHHTLIPLFEGNLLTQRHETCSQETRDSTLSQGEDPESISSGLESVPGRDRQTDRITIANTR